MVSTARIALLATLAFSATVAAQAPAEQLAPSTPATGNAMTVSLSAMAG